VVCRRFQRCRKLLAGYDFLLLRESAGEETGGLGEWWTRYQEVGDSQRREMIKNLSREDGAPAKRRRRGGSNRKRRTSDAPTAGDE